MIIGQRIFAIFLASISMCSRADTWIDVNVSAYHWNRDIARTDKLNENNFGLGIEYSWSNSLSGMVGFYDNSLNRHSNYILVAWTPVQITSVKFGAVVGGVTGYPIAPTIATFGGIITAQYKSVGFNILLVPSMKSSQVDGFAGFQLKVKL